MAIFVSPSQTSLFEPHNLRGVLLLNQAPRLLLDRDGINDVIPFFEGGGGRV